MERYCVICKRNTAKKNSSVRRTKQNILMLVPNYPFCGYKKTSLLKIKKHVHY